MRQVAAKYQAEIIAWEIMPDHVYRLVEGEPQFGIHGLVKNLEGAFSHTLRKEFRRLKSRLPTLWTNSYFVSTVGEAPLAVMKQYVRSKRMSKQRKVYKFRMEPTALQSDELLRMAGTARFIWNWALDRCQTFYKESKKGIPQSQLSSQLTALKGQQPWLYDFDSQSL